ncbi:MAG: hypothetical protein KDK70_26415 [Myxococcales bacterium]|nr:hypothetical protein [Myxococcales bacterium]
MLGLGLGMIVAAACRPKQRSNPPLCAFKAASEEELASQSLTPEQWLPIVSPSIDRAALARNGPLRDACGRVLEAPAEPWPACPGTYPPTVPRAGDRIEATDLIMSQVGEGRMLLWAATEELATGEAMGPAALVFWTDTGLEIHAAGMLRGLRNEARIRLHQTSGKPVVILESQECNANDECTPIAKFFPIVKRRFMDFPVKSAEGECNGSATFALSRKAEQPREGKLTRKFELQRSVELAEDGIYMVDLITGDEYNPKDPAGVVRPFRRVTARRKLELADDYFIVRDKDLWEHVLRDFGLVNPEGKEGARLDADAVEFGEEETEGDDEGDEGGDKPKGKKKTRK